MSAPCVCGKPACEVARLTAERDAFRAALAEVWEHFDGAGLTPERAEEIERPLYGPFPG